MSILVLLHGVLYRVSLAPAEQLQSQGQYQAVVFETADGRWVGSATTRLLLDLEELDRYELELLLREALRER